MIALGLSLALVAVLVLLFAELRSSGRLGKKCEELITGQTLLAAQRDNAYAQRDHAASELRVVADAATQLRNERHELRRQLEQAGRQADGWQLSHSRVCEERDAARDEVRALAADAHRASSECAEVQCKLNAANATIKAQMDALQRALQDCGCSRVDDDGNDEGCSRLWDALDKLDCAREDARRLARECGDANIARNQALAQLNEERRKREVLEATIRPELERYAETKRQLAAEVERLRAASLKHEAQLDAARKGVYARCDWTKCHRVLDVQAELKAANERCDKIAKQRDAYGNEDATMAERLNEMSCKWALAGDQRDEAEEQLTRKQAELSSEQYKHSGTQAKLESAQHELTMWQRKVEKLSERLSYVCGQTISWQKLKRELGLDTKKATRKRARK